MKGGIFVRMYFRNNEKGSSLENKEIATLALDSFSGRLFGLLSIVGPFGGRRRMHASIMGAPPNLASHACTTGFCNEKLPRVELF